MPSKPRYFTYSSMAFFPLLSIRCLYSGNWYKKMGRVFCRGVKIFNKKCNKREAKGWHVA
ncbi:hypothetical protein [Wolbachia endosymbiont (group B) of Gerris lacustris]|uniref:hypothetical protein n=1 Tax=Wolbachia endosymbiont (group B) of Gerris lacustris TaxID=3066159 RepID=UPI00333F3FD9